MLLKNIVEKYNLKNYVMYIYNCKTSDVPSHANVKPCGAVPHLSVPK